MIGFRRHRGGPLTGAFIVSVIFLTIGLSKATGALGAASIPIWAMVIAGAVFVLRGPLGEAILRSVSGDDSDPEQGLRSQEILQELDDLRSRVAELEERQDFSERMLTKQGDPMRVGGPSA